MSGYSNKSTFLPLTLSWLWEASGRGVVFSNTAKVGVNEARAAAEGAIGHLALVEAGGHRGCVIETGLRL